MRFLRARFTYANVMASIAVFVALGATGVASPMAQSATSVGKSVKRALKLSKSADKKATKALAFAKQAKGIKANGVGLGPAGPSGPKGERGPIGLTGSTGPTGSPGAAGATGPAGSASSAGARGPTGPQGLPGPTGPPGSPGTSSSTLAHAAKAAAVTLPNAPGYQDLGGPSVTVEIPPNALVSVFANAEISATQGCAAYGYLTFDSGETTMSPAYPLFDGNGLDPERFATSNNVENSIRARELQNIKWLGPFAATPGTRTYSIKYTKSGGTSCQATVRDRHLWVLVTKPTL